MPARKPDYREGTKIVVSNNYVRAIHPPRMGINAIKLFGLIVSQCRINDEEFYEYECKIKDLARLFETDPKDLHRDVQKLCKNIMQTVLYVGDGNPQHAWEYRTIFSKCRHDPNTGTVYVKLSPDVTDLFLRLTRNFTQMSKEAFLTMKSKYSIRLYTLISEKLRGALPYAANAIEINISLAEARQVTGTDNRKTYDMISHFKNKVWDPALKDIEAHASWKIVSKDIKQGRQIVGFDLQIWSRAGYEYVESKKKKGEFIDPNQMTIFDYMKLED